MQSSSKDNYSSLIELLQSINYYISWFVILASLFTDFVFGFVRLIYAKQFMIHYKTHRLHLNEEAAKRCDYVSIVSFHGEYVWRGVSWADSTDRGTGCLAY